MTIQSYARQLNILTNENKTIELKFSAHDDDALVEYPSSGTLKIKDWNTI